MVGLTRLEYSIKKLNRNIKQGEGIEKIKKNKRHEGCKRYKKIKMIHDEFGFSLAEIARKIGVSRQRVHQIYHQKK